MLRTILISGGALVINCMINFFLVPVISNSVGTEAYGFVSMAKNFESYVLILTAALNSFAVRHIVLAYHTDDREGANVFFSSTFYGDVILGTFLFLIAMLGIAFLEHLIQIPPALVTDVKWLFFFMLVNFWLVTVTTAFSSSAHVKNKLDVAGVFNVGAYLCEAALLVLCYGTLSQHVYYVGLGRAVEALILMLGAIWLWRHYTKELKVRRKYFSWRAIRALVSNGIWTSMNSLGGILNDGLDLLVCNLMLTPLSMGQLALAKTFYSIFGGAFRLVGQAFEPMLLKSYANKDTDSLLKQLKLSMNLSGMVSNIIFAGFLALGVSFYKLWIPKENIQLVYQLTIISNLATVPSGPLFPLYYIYVLTGKNRFPTIMTIVGGLFNVLAMYILLSTTNLGNYAILWTSVGVSALIGFVSNPLYMAHVLNQPWWTFYPGILRNLLSCGVMAVVFRGCSLLYTPDSWFAIVACACMLFLIGILLQTLVVSSKNDRKMILQMLKRKHSSIEAKS